MKTTEEPEPPINWPRELHLLHQIPKDEFDPDDPHFIHLCQMAGSFVTCAVSAHCANLPRFETSGRTWGRSHCVGEPRDAELARLGYEFHRRLCVVDLNECDRLLDAIEARAGELLEVR